MKPFDKPFPLFMQDRQANTQPSPHVFTHSARSRKMVLLVFGTYLAVFALFSQMLRNKLREFDQLPQYFASFNDPEIARLLIYGLAGISWIAALAILLYFLWAVIDIWGLQVWVSKDELRVANTITGARFANLFGVGIVAMDDIHTLKPGRVMTQVIGLHSKVKFSPVDQLETLIATIFAHARHIKIEE